jgi:hypothetical protein
MADKKPAPKDEQPKAEEPKTDNSGIAALEGKTIDERMAMLLKDHKAMGAR